MQGSVMHVTLAGQKQQSLRYCFNIIINSFKMTSGLEPESLQLSSQYPRECAQHSRRFMIFRIVSLLGSTKFNQLSQNCMERGVF